MTPPAPPLLDPAGLSGLRAMLEELGVDGWLLFDFHDQNPLAHELLGLEKTTRRAFALFPARGEPVLLRHAIEASAWRRWSWEVREYAGWQRLEDALADLLRGVGSVAMETSPGSAVPTVDRVPAGVVDLVRAAGARPVTSADLVTRYHSCWTPSGLAAHRRSSEVVRETAHEAFRRAVDGVRAGAPVGEAELMAWIEARLGERGVSEQVGCIVAVGRKASDPHYHPDGGGEPLTAGQPVLIDLWGAEPAGIPADQTWMGWIGDEPDPRTLEVWRAVRDARDRALEFLREGFRSGASIRGREVDRAARDLLTERGFGEWFVHRLGHSIDRELHGSGPNLDDLETRDDRRLLSGTGFSVEPGVYIPGEIGVRSEVNVHWGTEGPEVTPTRIQDELLRFPVT